jgi:hypothetical protein
MILAATDIVNFPVNIISCTWEFCEHNQLLLMGVFVNVISCSWEFCEQAMVPHCAQANPVRAAVQPCMHVWQSLKFRGSSCWRQGSTWDSTQCHQFHSQLPSASSRDPKYTIQSPPSFWRLTLSSIPMANGHNLMSCVQTCHENIHVFSSNWI